MTPSAKPAITTKNKAESYSDETAHLQRRPFVGLVSVDTSPHTVLSWAYVDIISTVNYVFPSSQGEISLAPLMYAWPIFPGPRCISAAELGQRLAGSLPSPGPALGYCVTLASGRAN